MKRRFWNLITLHLSWTLRVWEHQQPHSRGHLSSASLSPYLNSMTAPAAVFLSFSRSIKTAITIIPRDGKLGFARRTLTERASGPGGTFALPWEPPSNSYRNCAGTKWVITLVMLLEIRYWLVSLSWYCGEWISTGNILLNVVVMCGNPKQIMRKA